jgi:hypothetical protein
LKAGLLILMLLLSKEAVADNTNLPQKTAKLIIKITQGKKLWYFGGVSAPITFTDGDTTVMLTAMGQTQGTFKWDIIAGTDKVSLENGVQSVTKSNDNTLFVKSLAPSVTKNDVTIKLTFNGTQSANFSFEVRAPKRLVRLPSLDQNFGRGLGCFVSGVLGWESDIGYQVQNQFNEAVKNASVNETFGAESDPVANNWGGAPTPGNSAAADGTFADALCITGPGLSPQPIPPPSNPSNFSTQPIQSFVQHWFSGSATNGQGVQVQTDAATFFIDHGAALNITTP